MSEAARNARISAMQTEADDDATEHGKRFPYASIIPFPVFKNRYQSQECYVVGRGPTLFDYADLAALKEPIFFLNDAICLERLARGKTFFFAHDSKMLVWLNGQIRSTAVMPSDGKLFREEFQSLGHQHEIVFYHWRKRDGERLLRMNREQLASIEELYTHTGTIHSLLHFVWYCGFKNLKLIGCDGINTKGILEAKYPNCQGYDPRLENLSATKPWWQYDTIRRVQDRLIAHFGFEATYLGTPQMPT